MKFIIAILLVTTLSCTKDKIEISPPDEFKKYIHISHTRLVDNSAIHPKSTKIDYSSFDITMLGGDIAHLSSHDDQTLELIDSIFDIKANTTFWSLGNHDYSKPALIESYTNRPSYYTHHQNGITFVILDTQKDSCHIFNEQFQLVKDITDTISKSTHLLFLTHKLIWMPDHPILQEQVPKISNGQFGEFHYSLYYNNFYKDIYPRLVSTSDKGIKVVCLAGDIGKHANEFEYTTSDGIQYLASGLDYQSSDDQYLIFDHNLTKGTLTWKYVK
ncbi:MAG: hypothetical protein ACJA1A_001735 [Saprospiraceae bacterium]|jgi:hypothetical protein|tara:strand:+ start:2213 stop:3031 length:819 start_codon:yes stop_codon:yes gene_type:complete